MSRKIKDKIFLVISIFIYFLVNGCSQSNSLITPISTITPSLSLTIYSTHSPVKNIIFTVTPDFCNISQGQGEIKIMPQALFTALIPGNSIEFDRILVEQNKDWVNFEQEVEGEGFWSAGQIFASFAWGYELGTGVNPAVIFLTYGVEKNWELPANGDLISKVNFIRDTFRKHESDWILEKVDKTQYPPIANAASYAMYRYFNTNLSKLEEWCITYIKIYKESPLE